MPRVAADAVQMPRSVQHSLQQRVKVRSRVVALCQGVQTSRHTCSAGGALSPVKLPRQNVALNLLIDRTRSSRQPRLSNPTHRPPRLRVGEEHGSIQSTSPAADLHQDVLHVLIRCACRPVIAVDRLDCSGKEERFVDIAHDKIVWHTFRLLLIIPLFPFSINASTCISRGDDDLDEYSAARIRKRDSQGVRS